MLHQLVLISRINNEDEMTNYVKHIVTIKLITKIITTFTEHISTCSLMRKQFEGFKTTAGTIKILRCRDIAHKL